MNNGDCIHHFELPPTDGPVVIGICRKCGEAKEHVTSVDLGFGRSFVFTPTEPFKWHYGQNSDTYILSGDVIEEE